MSAFQCFDISCVGFNTSTSTFLDLRLQRFQDDTAHARHMLMQLNGKEIDRTKSI